MLTHKSAEPVLFENMRQFKSKALPDTPCLLFKGTKDLIDAAFKYKSFLGLGKSGSPVTHEAVFSWSEEITLPKKNGFHKTEQKEKREKYRQRSGVYNAVKGDRECMCLKRI